MCLRMGFFYLLHKNIFFIFYLFEPFMKTFSKIPLYFHNANNDILFCVHHLLFFLNCPCLR